MEQVPAHFKSGFAAIVGRPNVGKSTLMNTILGVSVSIATSKPQTTRNRILGIHTLPDRGQIVFVDTPGIHTGRSRLHARMARAAQEAAGDTDVVVWVVEANSLGTGARPALWGEDARILERLPAGAPLILVLNKIDLVHRHTDLLPVLGALGAMDRFAEIVPVSAAKGINVERIAGAVLGHLPEGPPLFDQDMVTDRAERFVASEIVRKQVLEQTEKEVPYGVAVEVEEFVDGADNVLHVHAVIHVERDGHKGILIGRAGSKLRDIGTAARAELEAFFGKRVDLRTFVRVEEGWTGSDDALRRFGYDEGEL